MTGRSFIERHLPRTISARLSLLFLVMASVFVIVIAATAAWTIREHFRQNVRPHLEKYLEYARADMGNPPDLERARKLAERVPVEIMIKGQGIDWTSSGRTVDERDIRVQRRFVMNGEEYFGGEFEHRQYLVTHAPGYTLIFSMPHPRQGFHAQHIVALVILLSLFLLFYYAARYLLTPVGAIKQGVQRIGDGDLSQRIVTPRQDELGDIATSINRMADDIQKMLDAKRQLLLAISHELRSPVTRARVSAAMVEDDRQRDELERDLVEMERLIEELLEAERLNSPHVVLHKSHVSLNKLIEETAAPYKGRGLIIDCPEGIELEADDSRLRLLIRNLLDNAWRHGGKATNPPELRVVATPTRISLMVRDYGPGISPDHLPYLTQPFYRADAARTRATGGYGLGLYLCRMIAEVHQGSLSIHSEVGEGVAVTVELPRKNA